MLERKKARAQHKRSLKMHKRDSWRRFVPEMSVNTPVAKVYETVGKKQGREQRKINILHEDGQYYTTVQEISDRLTQTFANIASTRKYDENFQRFKR